MLRRIAPALPRSGTAAPFRRAVLTFSLVAALVHGAPPKPENIPAFRDGLDALGSRLWEVAAARFEAALATPELDDGDRSAILLKLAESRIRAGDSEAASKTLADPALAGHPALAFWQAQALVAAGRFGEALALLDEKTTAAAAPHRIEAIFTRAALQRALGDIPGAIQSLASLTRDRNPAISRKARLRSAALHLAAGRPGEALAILPAENQLAGPEVAEALNLRAQALLAQDDPAAAGLFSSLLHRDDIPPGQRHAAHIGLAKARLAAGDPSSAADALLAFLQQNRVSPELRTAFDLLLDCLPAQPAPNDPILIRLAQWLPPPTARAPSGFSTENGSASVRPDPAPALDEFSIQTIYHHALALRRENSAASRADARRWLTRLRVEAPRHPLAARALLDTARWDLADGRREQAAAALAALAELPDESPALASLRAAALLTSARAAFDAGDFAAAAEPLDRALELLDDGPRDSALRNAAAALLAGGQAAAFDALAREPGDPRLAADLELEKALHLSSRRDPLALSALDRFILAHLDHPRLPEARLAAAHAALETAPPDLGHARAQLDSIPEDASLPADSLALARIRAAGLASRWADAAALAAGFIADHPDAPRLPEIQFELGLARFRNRDFNDAHIALKQLADAAPTGPLAAPALLLAAQAASHGATSQARLESLDLYDRLIVLDSPLSGIARLEKASVQIKLRQFAQAAEGLEPWFKAMKPDDPLRLTAGLLIGEALYARAGNNLSGLERALAHYDELLKGLPADSSRRFQIDYLRGVVLEHIAGASPSQQHREGEAFDAYYSVLEAAARIPVEEWKWVDNCGINARRMLEADGRWEAAIAVANKHAALGSPGSKEAAERAKTLGQEHMILQETPLEIPGTEGP